MTFKQFIKDPLMWWNIIIPAFIVLLIVIFQIVKLYAVFKYGDVPIQECPTWVVWMIKN